MLVKSIVLYVFVTVLAFVSGMMGVGMVWKDMFQKTVLMMDIPPEEKYQLELRNEIESTLSDISLLESKDYLELEKSACYALQMRLGALKPEKQSDLNMRKKLSDLYLKAKEKHSEMKRQNRCWPEDS